MIKWMIVLMVILGSISGWSTNFSDINNFVPEEEKIDFIKISDYPSEKLTTNNFGSSYDHRNIEPQFREQILTSKKDLSVLEIGPGDGHVLQQLLQDPRHTGVNLTYTIVELCPKQREEIKAIYKEFNRNFGNKLLVSKGGDIREFIKDKTDQYDMILCSQVLHFLKPTEQLNVLQGLYNSLKKDGWLGMITASIYGVNRWFKFEEKPQEESQEQKYATSFIFSFDQRLELGDLWPGYAFSSTLVGYYLYQKKSPDGLPCFHSVVSFKKLLSAVGFNIEKVKNFTEIADGVGIEAKVATIRVGAIVTKNLARQPDTQMLKKYQERANQLEDNIKKNLINAAKISLKICMKG